ncbi:conserved hypothetical protein [Hyella patelloides LEGE 07179]|uniref:Tellurite resistance protein TerB n=1 Tax=Hyella patelloides LEGE 07179 TaxID=945734 RepID=A0A563W5B0_9CYAN|nr:TerB family tellurite resistance protein [Hyella patelloides]VEP18837.1 conserved hypothetical protein [Hyella patelloides LEGE 07179]
MVRSTIRNNQQLFKILVAAAWIDGEFQAEEKTYLNKLAKDKNLLEDSEIQSLLSTTQPIDSEQCYQWLSEYLGSKPTEEVYQNLLAEIAGLVYIDGDIAEEEAKLLTQLQTLDPNNNNVASIFKPVLRVIRQLYRKQLNY